MPIVVSGIVEQTPATDATSPDGLIRAQVVEAYAGVFLTVDYSDLIADPGYNWANPFCGTIYRVDTLTNEKVVVRGADRRTQYGGIFYAYDDEVEFGKVYTYYVEGYDQHGALARRSYGVSVLTWEPPGGYVLPGVWIKSLDDPSLSMPVRVRSWKSGTYASRTSTATVLDSPYMAANQGVRSAYETSMTVLTADEDEYQQLLELSQYGTVYIVGLSKHRRRTGYYLLGDLSPSRVTDFVNSPYDAWDISNVVQQPRPVTTGQQGPVYPWRNLADRLAEFPTFNDVPAGRLLRDGALPD